MTLATAEMALFVARCLAGLALVHCFADAEDEPVAHRACRWNHEVRGFERVPIH